MKATLTISLLALSVFPAQYVFRYLDDNRLTSWQWVFAVVDVPTLFLSLIIGIFASHIFSRLSFPERRPTAFLLIFSFIVCMLFWKEAEVIVDASRYFTQAKHLSVYGIRYFIEEWGRGISAWTDMPLIPFLYGLIFKFFGESRAYIQIFTSLLFSMTCVITFSIGKTLWDKDIGFPAAMLLLGIPYLLTQVPLMLVDVPTMFFLTFSIFTFIKAMEKGRVWIVISSFSIFLTVFSKYSTWLMLSVIGVIILVYLIQSTKHRIENPDKNPKTAIYHSALVILFSAFLIGIVISLKFDVFTEQIKLLLSYQMPGLRRWGESFIYTFFYQIHPFISIAALYSLYLAFRKRDLRFIIVSWLVLLVILLQIKRIRYIMVMFPMFSLMASYGLQRIRTELRRFVVYYSVLSSLIIAVFVHLVFLQTTGLTNLRDAGRYLNSVDVEYVEVFTLPSKDSIVNPAASVPLLDIFTEREIYYNYDVSIPLASEEMQRSSLRFTWEYKNPEYYEINESISGQKTAIVAITDEPSQTLPEHIKEKTRDCIKAGVFDITEGVFIYSPTVIVYLCLTG